MEDGYYDYSKRMPPHCKLQLHELPLVKRQHQLDIQRVKEQENEKLRLAVPANNHIIALDVLGKQWDTPLLAKKMDQWLQSGNDISLIIGGPEGLTEQTKQQAKETWSLSPLTLPHMLVRVIVAEQLYRAHTLLTNHPYHRA